MTAYDSTTQEATWVSPPSDTILRLLYRRDITLSFLRANTGLSVGDFLDLLHDKISIDPNLAKHLSKILGGSINFWLSRYEYFYSNLATSNQAVVNENHQFLEELSKARHTTIDNLLDDFRVSTLESLVANYLHSPKIMFSKSQKIHPSPVKIASWIRNCEIIAEEIVVSQELSTFQVDKLESVFSDILALTKVNSIDKVKKRLQSVLLEAGVVLILSPSEVGNGVSGFTKPLLKKYKLVVVTDRYKNNAAFWFTLFHELAHCVLHSINEPLVHYSDALFSLASLPANDVYNEDEANNYVESLFFTEELKRQLPQNSKSYKNILRLGVKYDVPASLIVAQIHRLKLAPYSHFQKVYRKVKFQTIG